MIDPVRHMSLRQRVSVAIRIVNIILGLALLAFVLR